LKRRGLRWYRSQVGYVQQDPYGALPPFMNVQRILEEPMIINGVKDKASAWSASTRCWKKSR
jgi:peptide/nickel transport system ATP-binding protein